MQAIHAGHVGLSDAGLIWSWRGYFSDREAFSAVESDVNLYSETASQSRTRQEFAQRLARITEDMNTLRQTTSDIKSPRGRVGAGQEIGCRPNLRLLASQREWPADGPSPLKDAQYWSNFLRTYHQALAGVAFEQEIFIRSEIQMPLQRANLSDARPAPSDYARVILNSLERPSGDRRRKASPPARQLEGDTVIGPPKRRKRNWTTSTSETLPPGSMRSTTSPRQTLFGKNCAISPRASRCGLGTEWSKWPNPRLLVETPLLLNP